MWTVYENIEDDLWRNTHKTKQSKGTDKFNKRVLMLSRNWVSKDDLCRFAESCNYYRHGAKKPSNPDHPLLKDDERQIARQILTRILQSWLQEKIS